MSDTGAIYKNGVPFTEQDPSDIQVAASAMRAVCDAKGNKIKDTYVKKSKQTTEFFDTAAYHNSVYRGKDLNTRFKSGDLYAEIASGKFRDMFIGDYFNVSYKNPKNAEATVNLTCRFARFIDGDAPMAIIVPDAGIFGTVGVAWNLTETVEGGYASSNVKTEIETFVPTLTTLFGDHLKEMIVFNSGSVNTEVISGNGSGVNGLPGGVQTVRVKIDLMNEIEVFGTRIWGSGIYDNYTLYGHLPLFKFNPAQISPYKNIGFYLKSIVNMNKVVVVANGRSVMNTPTENSAVTRPKFAIG